MKKFIVSIYLITISLAYSCSAPLSTGIDIPAVSMPVLPDPIPSYSAKPLPVPFRVLEPSQVIPQSPSPSPSLSPSPSPSPSDSPYSTPKPTPTPTPKVSPSPSPSPSLSPSPSPSSEDPSPSPSDSVSP